MSVRMWDIRSLIIAGEKWHYHVVKLFSCSSKHMYILYSLQFQSQINMKQKCIYIFTKYKENVYRSVHSSPKLPRCHKQLKAKSINKVWHFIKVENVCNKNKLFIISYSNINKSHKHNVEQQSQAQKTYMLHLLVQSTQGTVKYLCVQK